MFKRTLREDIITAYEELGKTTLHLSQIYEKVRTIREHRGFDCTRGTC